MARGDFKASGQAWRRSRAAIIRRVQAGEPCHLCGQAIDLQLRTPDPASLEVDHRIARSRGGSMYDPANLWPSHRSCNRAKGDGTPRPGQPRRQAAGW
jgi:5-methylcytosine-specific restriction endonuclease McrA